jgi:hypothetical protein
MLSQTPIGDGGAGAARRDMPGTFDGFEHQLGMTTNATLDRCYWTAIARGAEPGSGPLEGQIEAVAWPSLRQKG